MSRSPVIVIGCGQMGRGITKMLLHERRRQNMTVDILIYDANLPNEDQCLLECKTVFGRRAVERLRDVDATMDWADIASLMYKAHDQSDIFLLLIRQLKKTFTLVQPRLILNAATYYAHRIYVPLAIDLGCDYIDLGQGIPSAEEREKHESTILEKKNRFSPYP